MKEIQQNKNYTDLVHNFCQTKIESHISNNKNKKYRYIYYFILIIRQIRWHHVFCTCRLSCDVIML